MASLKVVFEIFRRDAAEVEQESLETASPVADRVGVARPSEMLACGLVLNDVGYPEPPSAGHEAAPSFAIADLAFEAATYLRLSVENKPGLAATNRIQQSRRYLDLERIAACAAASLAIGTRYGEQDT